MRRLEYQPLVAGLGLAAWQAHVAALAWQAWAMGVRDWAGMLARLGLACVALMALEWSWWRAVGLAAPWEFAWHGTYKAWQAWHSRHWVCSGGVVGAGGRCRTLRGTRGT